MKRPPKYNPGFLDDQEIAELFCVRRRELGILVRTLEKNKGDINQHALVIGPRGSGKTLLLRRLAAKIRATPELEAVWYPIVFMEENYEILSLSDFWKEALYYSTNTTATTGRRIEQLQTEIPVSSEAKNATYEALKNPPGGAKNPYTEDIARARLLEFAERQGKRLLLICENMNDLLSVLSEQECWKLRNVLQTEKRIMLIGSATTRFEQIDHHKKAFYDFLKILELERLPTQECAELWHSMTGKEITDSQADAIRILTGGLPRLVSVLAWLGRGLSFLELMRDLEELIDDHTDYFKGTLKTLPAKERKVFASLARLWENSPVGSIAVEAGIGQPETSAILNRLIKRGIVEEYEEDGERPVKRGKTYQLTERLFNIFYLMRRGGAEALFVYSVVNFLVQVFGVDAKDALRELSDREPPQIERERRLLDLFRLHCRVNKTESALSELSELLKHPAHVREIIKSLADGCIELAAASPEVAQSIAEAIKESLSKELLYPLYVGIKLYLGDNMRLPREVREIAKVIREKIVSQSTLNTSVN